MINMERALFRRLWLPFYRWYALRKVRTTQVWRSHGLALEIPAGVFHPGLYFSTPFFLDFLKNIPFKNQKVLDVGTGSGVLAIFAARNGAVVDAVDIHPGAVATARKNAAALGVVVNIQQSDLFAALSPGKVDDVLVNPPYYPRNPANDAEHAFYAGEGLIYFQRFFSEIIPFCHPNTTIWMVLSEDCDWVTISGLAQKAGFGHVIAAEKKHWGERLFIAAFTRR